MNVILRCSVFPSDAVHSLSHWLFSLLAAISYCLFLFIQQNPCDNRIFWTQANFIVYLISKVMSDLMTDKSYSNIQFCSKSPYKVNLFRPWMEGRFRVCFSPIREFLSWLSIVFGNALIIQPITHHSLDLVVLLNDTRSVNVLNLSWSS